LRLRLCAGDDADHRRRSSGSEKAPSRYFQFRFSHVASWDFADPAAMFLNSHVGQGFKCGSFDETMSSSHAWNFIVQIKWPPGWSAGSKKARPEYPGRALRILAGAGPSPAQFPTPARQLGLRPDLVDKATAKRAAQFLARAEQDVLDSNRASFAD